MNRSVPVSTDDVRCGDRPPGAVPPTRSAAARLSSRCAAVRAAVPFPRLLVRRGRGGLALLVCVAQVWLMHAAHVVRCRLRTRFGHFTSDEGMTTAEYAVGTVAACGFAALLYKVVTSGAVSSALQGLIRRALGAV